MIRILIDRLHALEKKRYISAAGLSTDEKPTNNLITGSVFCEIDTGKTYRFDEASSSWLEQSSDAGAIESGRVTPLEGTALTGGVIDAIGIPEYVADAAQYAAYGITDTGWYVFARISVPQGTAVGAETTVTGADGVIAESGADHLDVAIRFEVASTSKSVIVVWEAGTTETFVFRAVDLAVRNLDYRSTFYVYDVSPFIRWTYDFTTDTTFADGKNYYVKADGEYTKAEVETKAYVLTEDETFQQSKTYYIKDGDKYTAATVTPGEAIPANTYYEQTTVPVPAYYVDVYTLTADETFQANKTYYTESGGVYSEATVTAGEAVTPDTYYEHSYAQAEGTFEDGVTYYTKSGSTYSEAVVTVGEAIPAYYVHTKLTFEGIPRNVTYRLDEIVDCASEFILPEIEDNDHGAWFEIQLRHSGSYSMTLIPPEGVKVATEHTQAESAGMNMIDLHYMNIDGVKIWRFMNTHATIPT